MLLLSVALLILVIVLLCLVANALLLACVPSFSARKWLAVLLVPFVPAAAFFGLVYPGLLPWNAAGAIAFYPVLHAIFVIASAVSLVILERLSFRSPPPS